MSEMMATAHHDIIMVVAGGMLLIAQVGAFSWKFGFWGIATAMIELGSDLRSKATHSIWTCVRAPLQGVSGETKEFLLDWQIRFAHKLVACMWLCTLAMLVQVVANIFSGRMRWMTPALDYSLLLSVAVLSVIRFFPSLINSKSLDTWCGVGMLCSILGDALLTGAGTPATVAFVIFARFALGVLCIDLRLMVLWNLLAVVFACFAREIFPAGLTVPTSGHPVPGLLIIITALVGVLVVKNVLVAEAVFRVQARNGKSAATALLSTMNDAIVELDSKLAIVGPARQLACLLLSGSHRSLDGDQFTRFIASECDKERFVESIQEPSASDNATTANMIHLELKDCFRASIPVSIYHVQCPGITGWGERSTRHLLSIREFGDEVSARHCGARAPPSTSDVVHPLVDERHRAGRSEPSGADSDSASDSTSWRSNSSGRRSTSPTQVGESCLDLTAISFDPGTDQVLDVTTGLPPRPLPITHSACFQDTLAAGGEAARSVYSTWARVFDSNKELQTVTFSLGDACWINSTDATCVVTLKRKSTHAKPIGIASLRRPSPICPAVAAHNGSTGNSESRNASGNQTFSDRLDDGNIDSTVNSNQCAGPVLPPQPAISSMLATDVHASGHGATSSFLTSL